MIKEARLLSLATTRNSISPVRSSITAGFSGNGIGCAAGVRAPEGGGDSDCDFLMRLWDVFSAESSDALRFEAERVVRLFAPRKMEGRVDLLSVFVADGAMVAVFYVINMCCYRGGV